MRKRSEVARRRGADGWAVNGAREQSGGREERLEDVVR